MRRSIPRSVWPEDTLQARTQQFVVLEAQQGQSRSREEGSASDQHQGQERQGRQGCR